MRMRREERTFAAEEVRRMEQRRWMGRCTERRERLAGRERRGRRSVARKKRLTVKGSTTPELEPFVSESTRFTRCFLSL